MHLTLKEYDRALAVIATARRVQPGASQPADPDSMMAFYDALVYARKGDFPAADRLYLQLAEDGKVEPYVRGLALMGLANVRLAARDGDGMNRALDKLVALFPGLNAPDHFSEAETIERYRDQARRTSPASQPSRPSNATSRPGSAASPER
jgi:hypothetical protein